MDAPVSSLYGPGAIICWLCTIVSVLLNWSLNSSSRQHDTITNDFVACLSLPAIAAVHLAYALCTFSGPGPETGNREANSTMNAAFTVCIDFAVVAPIMLALASYHWHWRRWIPTLLVGAGCLVITSFVVISKSHKHAAPQFDPANITLAFWASILGVAFFPTLLGLTTIAPVLGWSSRLQQMGLVGRMKWTKCMTTVYGAIWITYWFELFTWISYSPYSKIRERILPTTPYTIHDLDQAVALGVGTLTITLAIYELVRDCLCTPQKEFDDWKLRCIRQIENGDMSLEVDQYRDGLRAIEEKIQEVLEADERWELAITTWKKLGKEEKAKKRREPWSNLTTEEKKIIDGERVDALLRESGFI
ncbi:hypothetical protein BDV96DRAFT_685537 [Lophiotrema nucula]|uniref:Uncharacterized protein n=1 Tax=Lophiotrema nucula TaxID=690887 RepID=A0A6A5ZEK1_9PLEO|nr:hypothetical protein BDV96DRAFT_685537 [Lophiotrema nucula]